MNNDPRRETLSLMSRHHQRWSRSGDGCGALLIPATGGAVSLHYNGGPRGPNRGKGFPNIDLEMGNSWETAC